FVQKQIRAVEDNDLIQFDELLFKHIGFAGSNALRSFLFALTGGWPAVAPGDDVTSSYFRRLTRFSAAYALMTDAALVTLGKSFKVEEKVSGRLADALAWMYLASAAIKKFHDEGRPADDLPLLRWSCDLALWKIQEALVGVIANLPNRTAAVILGIFVFPFGARLRPPLDELGAQVARSMLDNGSMRLRLTQDIFSPDLGEEGLGQLEAALTLVATAREAYKKTRDAVSRGQLEK